MLVDNKDYFEEDIETLSEVPDVYNYGRSYKGYRNGYFSQELRQRCKGKGKVLSNGAKGGLVKSYKEIPLWTPKQQKIMDKVDKIIERKIK